MKYMGMPKGMWVLFKGSFQKKLTTVFGYDATTAAEIRKSAKSKYKDMISKLPEFEKADRFRLTSVEPRYGLVFCLLPSALHSFLKYESIPANSCFPERKKAKTQTPRPAI